MSTEYFDYSMSSLASRVFVDNSVGDIAAREYADEEVD